MVRPENVCLESEAEDIGNGVVVCWTVLFSEVGLEVRSENN